MTFETAFHILDAALIIVGLVSFVVSVIALVRSFRVEHLLNESEHNMLSWLDAAEHRERERNANR